MIWNWQWNVCVCACVCASFRWNNKIDSLEIELNLWVFCVYIKFIHEIHLLSWTSINISNSSSSGSSRRKNQQKIPLSYNRIGQKQSSKKKEAYYKFIQFEKLILNLIPFEFCLFWMFSYILRIIIERDSNWKRNEI